APADRRSGPRLRPRTGRCHDCSLGGKCRCDRGAQLADTNGGSAATALDETAAAEPQPSAEAMIPSAPGPKRAARYGLSIEFETRSSDPEIARLIESTVWVNDAHPAFRRAVLSRSEGYHLALAVAMALAPLAAEPAQQHRFVTTFLGHWGLSLENGGRGKRGR